MLLSEKIRNIATPGDLFPELSAAEKKTDYILADIAVKIREKRKTMQMSQKEFAKFLGVSQSMVSKWEGAEYNFSIEKLVDLFTRLDIPITKLNLENDFTIKDGQCRLMTQKIC